MISNPEKTALLIVDLQNDFLHLDGAYARGGQTSAEIAALPERIKPVADALRAAG
ncbi:MAG: isochorismatase family protein, partial [Rhodobacteraceae bacterium]|nr:isochorismatase family protein [Paracoccaceae bacterium]